MIPTLDAQITSGMPEADYHAHPALSSTGARLLLDSPARFRYRMDNAEPQKDAFDIGSAVHAKVLGVGAEITVIPDDVLASNGATSTTAAKAFIADARAQGLIPLKSAIAGTIDQMAEAVLRNTEARELMEKEGESELSAFATDPVTGVPLRARFDRLTKDRSALIDLKTANSASRDQFTRTVGERRYDVQDAHYEDVLALIEGSSPTMQFIVVEKHEPYLVAVHRLSDEFAEIGHHDAAKARAIYAACVEHDTWPGYPANQPALMPPFWLTAQYMESRLS